MRHCFGRQMFFPNIKAMISEHLNMMKPYTTGAKTVFIGRNGENVPSVMTNNIDINTFTSKIVEERQIKKPKLILGADGSTSKCIIVGMIVEAGEESRPPKMSCPKVRSPTKSL